MKILLTGRNGQVGFELEKALTALGTVIATDRSSLDIFYPDLIRQAVRQAKPDIIVNAAAYTAVDKAESEPDLAMEVNGVAPGILGEEAKRLGALLVHYSTDYVFDGSQKTPYREDDAPNPLSVYGRTKLEGERAVRAAGARHLILRTAWVYDTRGRNFACAILAKAAAGETLRVVDDQFGAPTWARDIATVTSKLLELDEAPSGTFHVSAQGEATWYQVAAQILQLKGLRTPLVPIATRDYPTAAQRPPYSVLDNSRLEAAGVPRIGPWRDRLAASLGADAAKGK